MNSYIWYKYWYKSTLQSKIERSILKNYCEIERTKIQENRGPINIYWLLLIVTNRTNWKIHLYKIQSLPIFDMNLLN